MKKFKTGCRNVGRSILKLHRSEGFTLIELMIVIMIIALLAMIATPQYLKMKAAGCVSEFDQVLEAVNVSQKLSLHREGRYVSAVGIEEMEENLKNFELDKPARFFSYSVNASDDTYTLSAHAIEGACPGLTAACSITWTKGDSESTRSEECP